MGAFPKAYPDREKRKRGVFAKIVDPIKLDIGSGPNKKPGFVGMDAIAFPGVDHVVNIGADRWPFKDGSVSEAHCSHVLEHLTNFGGAFERVHFFNELYRVLAVGGTCLLVIPHWCSVRYYGDPTHKEPFSEMGFYYLDPTWRAGNAPHADRALLTQAGASKETQRQGYACDFTATWGFSLHQGLMGRNTEYQQHALTYWKEAAQDVIATLTKRAMA